MAAPKKNDKPTKAAAPAVPEVKEPEAPETVTEATAEAIGAKIEKETREMLANDEFVTMMFPKDPSAQENDQFFVHCINGVIVRYKRGEYVQVPKTIADTVERKARMRNESVQRIKAFLGDGKNLNE